MTRSHGRPVPGARATWFAEPSWWYPEQDDELHGSERSNLNVLASSDPPYGRETGSTMPRGYVCRVSVVN